MSGSLQQTSGNVQCTLEFSWNFKKLQEISSKLSRVYWSAKLLRKCSIKYKNVQRTSEDVKWFSENLKNCLVIDSRVLWETRLPSLTFGNLYKFVDSSLQKLNFKAAWMSFCSAWQLHLIFCCSNSCIFPRDRSEFMLSYIRYKSQSNKMLDEVGKHYKLESIQLGNAVSGMSYRQTNVNFQKWPRGRWREFN